MTELCTSKKEWLAVYYPSTPPPPHVKNFRAFWSYYIKTIVLPYYIDSSFPRKYYTTDNQKEAKINHPSGKS